MIGSNRVPSAMRLLAVANMLVSVGYVSAIPEELLAVKEKEPPERRSLFELKGVSRRVDPARRVRRTEVKQRFNDFIFKDVNKQLRDRGIKLDDWDRE